MNSAIVLNWNESHVSVDTVKLLLAEGVEVVVVDNGSEDGSFEKFKQFGDEIKLIGCGGNYGSSHGRNLGIELVTNENTFLIDGDILYVLGTIAAYEEVLKEFPEVACVGYFDAQHRADHGWAHGARSREQADKMMTPFDKIANWYPMAWTQYGLFRTELLRKFKFITKPPFNQYGYGLEDDWLFQQFRSNGYESVSVNKPFYYHDAHFSMRELAKKGLSDMSGERLELYSKHWGENNTSGHKLNQGVKITYKKIIS
jgi:GT2 family glycosyltransferase